MKRLIERAAGFALAAVMAVTTFGSPLPTSAAEAGSGKIQAQFFVSPKGSDTNDGSYNKPFASLEAARDAVRKINGSMTGDIYVFVSEGSYYMEDTLTLDESDSGTNGYKVIYRNLDKIGSAELIGGRKVESKWELVDASGDPATDPDADLPASAAGKVYKTNVGADLDFYTLYVNDRRATLARTRNRENSFGFESALTPYMRSAGGGVGDLIYQAGDLNQDAIDGLVNAQKRGDLDASVYMWDGGYWDWMTDTIPIASIDTSKRQLLYKTVDGHPEMYRPKYATRNNARYFVQGNLGLLDAPGEYYYNHTTGDLYYYPEGNIADQDIVIPCVQEIVRVEGASKDSTVKNIEFSGLAFKDTDTTEWYAYGWNWGDAGEGLGFYPEQAKGSTQPSYCEQTERIEFQYGNITLVNTENIAITNSHIKNSGMFGIELYLANKGTMIENCLIEYTGHGGINLDGGYPGIAGDGNGDGYSRDNTIRNCIIHDMGELIGQASGFTIQQSGYNTVSHVEIYNSPRRGIFLTAGNSRNPGASFPDGDADYNPMTDMYTHHNLIEYVYLHDCQQDGGDDGAFFACYLYKGKDNYKPNYVDQMLIENVAANPSMTDIAPNEINLDMGASGMELSNMKVVNPQHYNIEVNTILQYGDVITFDNVNIDYGTLVNHLDEFDDSKMEYDKIGVTIDFPAEYQQKASIAEKPADIYFEEDFEGGSIDFSKWSSKGGIPVITPEWMSEGVLEGKGALKIDSDREKQVLYREFPESLNKIVTMKLFDRGSDNQAAYDSGVSINMNISTFGRVDDGTTPVGIGIDKSVGGGSSDGTYVLLVGSQKIKTDVSRHFGWHELKWDYTSGTDVKLYIDGKLVKTLTAADGVSTSFDYVSMGSEDGSGVNYYDELYVYGGQPATQEPGAAPLPEVPIYDGEDNVTQLELDFEDGQLPEGFYFTKPNGGGDMNLQIVQEAENNVLKLETIDSKAFFKTNADWRNYMVKMKWKFGEWGNNNVLDFAYDNFTIYVMTTSDGSDNQNKNPICYQVIYRRNYKGSGEFPAGTPYFEICKHAPSDTSLGKVAVPEGFNDQEWHDFQIQTFDGKVGFSVDGEVLFSVNDGACTSGGFGFGSLNGSAYMDDIQIITNPTAVDYGTGLGLDNIDINGEFNPNHYEYYVTVDDPKQVVTFTMPEVNDPTVTVTAELNGEVIASSKDTKQAAVNAVGLSITEEDLEDEAGKADSTKEEIQDKVIQEEEIQEEGLQEEESQDQEAREETPQKETVQEEIKPESQYMAGLNEEDQEADAEGNQEKDSQEADAEGNQNKDSQEADVEGNQNKDSQETVAEGSQSKEGQEADAEGIQNKEGQEAAMEGDQNKDNQEAGAEDGQNKEEQKADAEGSQKQDMPARAAKNEMAVRAMAAETRNTPITLNLKRGINELILTETTMAGDKVYRIRINKIVGIAGIGQIPAVTTERGTAPVLPETVKVDFADGGSEDVAIVWRMINPMLYRQNGTFTVYGSLDGFPDGKVSAQVSVNGLSGGAGSSSEVSFGILPVVTTQVGKAPALPKTITVYRSDGQQSAALNFAELSKELYAQPGTVFAVATVEGYEKIVLQEVQVKAADLSSLTELVEQAREILGRKGEYVDAGWQEFESAIEAAQRVLDTTDPDASDVEAALDRLQKAMNALRRKADKSQLKQAIDEAEAIDLSGYSKESADALQKALANAKALLADESLSEDDQGRIDQAVKALRDAIENLKKPGEGTGDSGQGNNNSGQNINGTQSGKPKTGDDTSLTNWILVGMAAALMFAAMVAAEYRKKREGV